MSAPEGTWLWAKLMDWCQKRRVSPAEYNDLFAIVTEAHLRDQAVAELIAALQEVKQWNDVSGIDDEWPLVMGSVNAALGRVTGEQA